MSGGRSSKRKGAKAERECCAILSSLLGYEVKRRLGAARSGGDDCSDLNDWSVEIKRVEKLKLPKWWRQAVAQSERYRKRPCLIYRQSGEPWRVVVRAFDILPLRLYNSKTDTVTISMEEFAMLVKWEAS